jgi:eukaryotic-like serine/threonine-protein kinase
MTENNPGLMTLFNEALERTDPALRAAYLDRVCGHDAELRRRLEELLSAHQAAGRFLLPDPQQTIDRTGTFQAENQTGEHAYSDSTDTYRTPTTRTERTTTNELGTVIAGRYTLVEVIGEGGMGSVYLAEQSEPVKRKVALKLIKSGMDSRGVLARFDAERQALALMDHPNIARIYDGGLTPDWAAVLRHGIG